MSRPLKSEESQETLPLAPEITGKLLTCEECGASLNETLKKALSGSPLLAQASVEQIVAELSRRGQHALLTLLSSAELSSAEDVDLLHEAMLSGGTPKLSVRHLSTDGLSEIECQELLTKLCQPVSDSITTTAANNSPTKPSAQIQEEENFSFKGDPIGMKLSEFKMRHERTAPGRRRRMPWCSDETPNAKIPELLYEPALSHLGIVHARIDLPEENNSPTVGGGATQAVIYQFIDGLLFQVTGFFEVEDFPKVAQAIRDKYGAPDSEEQSPLRLQWWQGDSTLEIKCGLVHPREPSVFRCYHDDLLTVASERHPHAADDL